MPSLNVSDFYLLRRPLKSIDDLFALNNAVIAGGKDAFGQGIKQLFSSPQMEEAIYIASPDLYRELKKWQSNEKAEAPHTDKLLQALYKYYIRMCMRSTPYGLFAGCTTGTIGQPPTNITFSSSEAESLYKHSRLDMNYVAEIASFLLKDAVVRRQIRFRPNSSLYKAGDTYRYVEFFLKNKRRSYFVSAVKIATHIDTLLEFTRDGKRIAEIVQVLTEAGFNEADATDFTEQLIDAQMLVSELEPTVTGEEFFNVLLAKLKTFDHTDQYAEVLQRIATLLQNQEHLVDHYQAIQSLINQHFVATASKDLVQTDLFFISQQNNINKGAVERLSKQLEKLLFLNLAGSSLHLEAFRKRFRAKYDEQEIPLAIAMDSEIGVGYGLNVNGISDYMPLLKDVILPGEAAVPTGSWGKLTRLKQSMLLNAKVKGSVVVTLSDTDMDELNEQYPVSENLPRSAYVAGTFLAKTAEDLDADRFKFALAALAGPSAANLMARFCHGNPALTEKLKGSIQQEEEANPEAIYAEIVHLPKARTGNILLRAGLRAYEIPYLGQASVPLANQIPLDDLMVSVNGGRVLLRSKKLNKEIIPRLTSAHNFSSGLPIYKFLCELQAQEQPLHIGWNWAPFDQETFLPRVEYKNIILSRARWYLKKADYPALKDKHLDLMAFFAALRQEWNMPRHVVIQEGDNELLIDFDNSYSLQYLAQALRKHTITLYEFLSTPDNCFIKSGTQSFVNEVIIPVQVTPSSAAPSAKPTMATQKVRPVKRQFMPGSEWLYVKIYTGNKTADRVLTESILPLAKQLVAENVIEQWFFIRYTDPDGHLRIRFHHPVKRDFWKEVLERLHASLAPWMEQGLVAQVVLDTYEREIERYGAATIALNEQLFCSDSIAIAEFLNLLRGDKGEKYRWLVALRNVDMLLNDFGYSLGDKYDLLKKLQRMFYEEFNNQSKEERLRHSLNDKYRQDSKLVEAILDPAKDADVALAVACFTRRSARNRPLIEQLAKASQLDARQAIAALLPSLIHMTLNRTFVAKPRMHELVVYHYLSKYYESQVARQKKCQPVEKPEKEAVLQCSV